MRRIQFVVLVCFLVLASHAMAGDKHNLETGVLNPKKTAPAQDGSAVPGNSEKVGGELALAMFTTRLLQIQSSLERVEQQLAELKIKWQASEKRGGPLVAQLHQLESRSERILEHSRLKRSHAEARAGVKALEATVALIASALSSGFDEDIRELIANYIQEDEEGRLIASGDIAFRARAEADPARKKLLGNLSDVLLRYGYELIIRVDEKLLRAPEASDQLVVSACLLQLQVAGEEQREALDRLKLMLSERISKANAVVAKLEEDMSSLKAKYPADFAEQEALKKHLDALREERGGILDQRKSLEKERTKLQQSYDAVQTARDKVEADLKAGK
jgi:chromosome segregation ATPase